MLGDFKTIKEILPDIIDNIENANMKKFPHFNRTYYANLDSLIDGLNNGELITIAGEKNNYSSLFMLNLAKNCILKGEKHVLLLDFGFTNKYSELLEIIKISKTCKYHKLSINNPIDSIYESIQNFLKIHPDCMIFINGLDQIFNDVHLRFDFRKKLEQFSIKLKNIARKNDVPIIITLKLSLFLKYYRSTYVELYNLGIFDAFACYSDKVLTTKFFNSNTQEMMRKDLDVKVVKNKNGRTGTLYFGLYEETQNIVECDYYTDDDKLSAAF